MDSLDKKLFQAEDAPKLFPFQEEGVNFLKSKNRCLLLDEMGLGKSVQAVSATHDFSRVLVVCPASLKIQWQREFAKWNPTCSVTIVSYNYIQMKKNAAQLSAVKWDCVIADECQAVSNWTSKQTQNFIGLVIKNAKRVYLLSGTPATKSAANWHPLLSIVEPGKWGKFQHFCEVYCEKKEIYVQTKFGSKKIVKWEGFRNTENLKKSVKLVSLRRLKKDVAPQMPQKFYTNNYVEIDASDINIEGVSDEVIEHCIENSVPLPEHVSKVRQQIGLAKIAPYLELETEEKPTIIFAWHTAVINELTRELTKHGKRVESILGSDLSSHRQRAVDSFSSGDIDILVLSIACCGVGLNLPTAQQIDFLELPWSAALMDQASDRAVRLTSKQDRVNIRNILAAGTIDERVLNVLTQKRIGMEKVING